MSDRKSTQVRPGSKLRVLMIVMATAVGSAGVAVPIEGATDSLRIVAKFDDASPLVVGNQVKIDGVVVGTVGNMAARNNKAIVTLHLDGSAQPLHADAQATIRPVTILGERYVDVERGTPSAPLLRPGAILPAKQTRQATALHDVLNMVDRPTGQALAALVTMLGKGMQGRGKDADAAIRVLESAMRDTDRMVKVLKQQTQLLTNLIDKLQPVADALATDRGKTLDRLVGSTQRVLASTVRNDASLEALLAELPSTLKEARTTLAQLAGTAGATTNVLQGLRPTTNNLAAISRELREFSESADPALATAEPVLEHAEKLLEQARPLVAELRKAGPDLKGTAEAAKPLITGLADNLDNVLNFFKYWALATNGWDGLSHYFRGMVIINPEQLTGLLPATGAPKTEGAPGAKKQSVPRKPVPDLPSPGGLLDNIKPDPNEGGVTGLTQQQEGRALDFLLGGS